jgi:triacylglycerol lipase
MRADRGRKRHRETCLSALLLLLLVTGQSVAQTEPDTVILLHGLGGARHSLKLMEWRLEKAGYRVHSLHYPRRAESIDVIVAALHNKYLECCVESGGRIHFVTHSLGAIAARAYIAEHRPANLGRIVMVAPPNGGSEIVDRMRNWWLSDLVLGPMGLQLGTGPEDLPARAPVPDCDVGVIAGDHWINPFGRFMLPAPHDGTVAVIRTHLPGMKDHLIVPHTHTFIMNSARVSRETIYFLREGRFEHTSS